MDGGASLPPHSSVLWSLPGSTGAAPAWPCPQGCSLGDNGRESVPRSDTPYVAPDQGLPGELRDEGIPTDTAAGQLPQSLGPAELQQLLKTSNMGPLPSRPYTPRRVPCRRGT